MNSPVISLRLPPDELRALEQAAAGLGISKSECLRLAIGVTLKQENVEKKLVGALAEIRRKKNQDAHIKRTRAAERAKTPKRIFALAAQAGISDLPDEVLKAAFFRLAAEQKPKKTDEVNHD